MLIAAHAAIDLGAGSCAATETARLALHWTLGFLLCIDIDQSVMPTLSQQSAPWNSG
jgi:hypothetical protein